MMTKPIHYLCLLYQKYKPLFVMTNDTSLAIFNPIYDWKELNKRGQVISTDSLHFPKLRFIHLHNPLYTILAKWALV